MKKLFVTTILFAISLAICSGADKDITTEIKNVTVYRQGALVSRTGDIFLQKGNTTLLFKGLPAGIIPESIQAKASGEVLITSVNHRVDYLNRNAVSKEISSLNDRRRALADSIKMLGNYKSVYKQEKEMILANKSIGGGDGVDISELEQAAVFFRKRLSEIEVAMHRVDNILYDLKKDMVNMSKQLLELNASIDLPSSVVAVTLSVARDMNTTLHLDYFIEEAGWTPSYDVRIKDVSEPLTLFYKARVFQDTNEDWDNVSLMLSTGNPSLSNNKPDLAAYYLTFDNYYRPVTGVMYNGQAKTFNGQVTGRVIDGETGEGLPGATIVVRGTTDGTVSDIDGKFSITLPQGRNAIIVSFIGFKSQEITPGTSEVTVPLIADMMALDEVVVVGYGSSGDSEYQASPSYAPRERKIEQIPLAIEKRQLTTEFRIDIPYSIPSDNKPYDVTMVGYDIDAAYEYTAVPKMSKDAFLVAMIPDFIKYDLLAGEANIFFKGVYQGRSYIDPDTEKDTLTISVGRDKDIIVMRDIQKDFTSRSVSGITKKEQKAWLITVRNNKDVAVNITVEDQFPVSRVDDIKVDIAEVSGGKADASTGRVTWVLKMNPGEKKDLTLRYSVRYPSGRSVVVD